MGVGSGGSPPGRRPEQHSPLEPARLAEPGLANSPARASPTRTSPGPNSPRRSITSSRPGRPSANLPLDPRPAAAGSIGRRAGNGTSTRARLEAVLDAVIRGVCSSQDPASPAGKSSWAPLAPGPVPHRPAARRAGSKPPCARPALPRGPPQGTVARHPAHRDQARAPLVPVRAPLRVTPSVRTSHPMTRLEHVSDSLGCGASALGLVTLRHVPRLPRFGTQV